MITGTCTSTYCCAAWRVTASLTAIEHIGRAALRRVHAAGPARLIRGPLFDGDPCPPVASPRPVLVDSEHVGNLTSAAWSPRFAANVGLGMLDREFWRPGRRVTVGVPDGAARNGIVVTPPFADDLRLG